MPLSEEEAEDLLRRLELRAGQDDAVAYAQDRPVFAGLWFDQRDGGAAHYTFTDNVAEHRSPILEMAPQGADIHVTQADYRMSELTGIKDGITGNMLSLIDWRGRRPGLQRFVPLRQGQLSPDEGRPADHRPGHRSMHIGVPGGEG